MPKLKYQQDQEKMAQEAQQRDLQNQYLAVKPEVALQTADQKDQQIAQGSRRLDIAAEKNAADAEYKHNLLILGKTKADQINQYRQQILQLKQQGADQNDQRIKILQQRADEAARHNKVAEGNQKTAETGRNNRAALRSAMASQLKILEEAGKTGRQTQAEEARRKLKELQDQYDANP